MTLLALEQVTAEERQEYALELLEPRPKTRGECAGGERPCPWVGCKHHLYLDVNEDNGSVKLNFDGEPEDLEESCALDVADRGGVTLDVVGSLLRVVRERVRQIETKALAFAERRHRHVDFEEMPERRGSPLALVIVDEGGGGGREETVRRAHENARRRKLGLAPPVVERSVVPAGNLPAPVPRALHRCKHCQVRTNEPDRAQHLARHGITGDPSEHFTPDDSVQKPIGRPEGVAMFKLAAKARRAAYAAAPRPEPDERPTHPVATAVVRRVVAPIKEITMSEKDPNWLSSAEAAELLGVGTGRVAALARKGELEHRNPSGGKRGPFEFSRSSVIARRDAEKKPRATKRPPPPEEQARAPRQATKAPKREAAPREGAPAELAESVRALLKVYDLGILDAEATLMHIQPLVGL